MEKGKSIQVELTEGELHRKIEQITRKIQEFREEGLRVKVDTSVYKAATAALDEDLGSKMMKKKKKKDIEVEREDLSKKFDMI